MPPRFSFAVSDVQYLLTFFIMLAVGLITGQLTAGLRFQARVAAHREERAGSLYEIARDLSGARADRTGGAESATSPSSALFARTPRCCCRMRRAS